MTGNVFTAGEAASILFGVFFLLLILRVPVAFALGLACLPLFYFEPRLSESHNISCNSCHLVGLGGVDGRPNSIGHNWQRGGRNAPTVLNAVFNEFQFWDGRAPSLEEQAKGPMINPVEMGFGSHADLVTNLRAAKAYDADFQKVFGREANIEDVVAAIAAFERTVVSGDSSFDRFMAASGMSGNAASFGSCTMVVPPYWPTAHKPEAPSAMVPVSTTPTDRCAQQTAIDRSIGSMAGRTLFSRAPAPRATVSPSTSKWRPGGATRICPFLNLSPWTANLAGSGPARLSMSGKADRLSRAR